MLHHVAFVHWLAPMLGFAIAWLLSSQRNDRATLGMIVATLFLLLMSLMYAVAGPHGYAVFQKVVVVAAEVWFSLLFLQISSMTVSVFSGATRSAIVARKASRYLAKIQRGPRRN